MKKNKILLVLLATVVLSLGTVLLTACTHEHTWGEWTVDKQATCTEEGERSHTCTSCDEIETETLDALGHSFAAEWTHDESKHWHVCSVCSAKDAEADHTMVDQECSVCGYELYTANLTYTLSEDEKSYAVSGENLTETDKIIRIPATHEGLPVTTIAEDAFYRNSYIEKVILPDSVTLIDQGAFYRCGKLSSVTLDSGLTTIGYRAFYRCEELSSITIPKSVTSIGMAVFGASGVVSVTVEADNPVYKSEGNCIIEVATKTLVAGLKSSIIPTDGSVEIIAESAFYFCLGLTSISIPSSIKSIGRLAFSSCNDLIRINYLGDVAGWCNIEFGSNSANPLDYGKNLYINDTLVTDLVIPEGVTSISDYAFFECTTLKSITFPSTLKSIDGSTFSSCESLEKVNYLGDIGSWCQIDFIGSYSNPTRYSENLYINNKLVTEVVLPNSLTEIGNYAFYNCKDIETVTFGNALTTIGKYAFYFCESLESIEIPAGVTTLERAVFYWCTSLKSVVIPDSVTVIEPFAFGGCKLLNNVVLPKNLTSIGGYAFDACSALESIVIPDGVTTIEDATFIECTSLKSMVIPAGVTSIGGEAFRDCTSLESVVIPDTVTTIGNRAFYWCSALKSVTIPDSVTSISWDAFHSCSSLESMVLGSGITDIDSSIFGGTTALKTLNYTGTIEDWCNIEFYDRHSNPISWADNFYISGNTITDLVIPESITSIGDGQFYALKSLQSVTFHDGIENIGEYSFAYCEDLTGHLTIPDSVKSIGYSAFRQTGITSLSLGSGIGYIYENAFYDCRNLTGELVVPEGIMLVAGAFSNTNISSVKFVGYPISVDTAAFDGCPMLSLTEYENGYYLGNGGNDYYLYLKPTTNSLSTVELHESTKVIAGAAFNGNLNLNFITLPEGLEKIGRYAFGNCNSLLEICNLSSIEITLGSEDNGYIGCYAKNIYTKTSGESKSFTTTDGYVFYYEDGTYSLVNYTGKEKDLILPKTINGSIYEIGEYAFAYRDDLDSVVIPEGITKIGSHAFRECVSMTNLVIPDSVTTIGARAFYFWSQAITLTLGSGVTDIGEGAFTSWGSLLEIYNRSSLELELGSTDNGGIANYAKNIYTPTTGESKLATTEDKYLTYDDGTDCLLVRYVGTEKDLELPATINGKSYSIYRWAFALTHDIDSVKLSDGVVSVGYGAFGQSDIKSVFISKSVTEIERAVFFDCTMLESLVVDPANTVYKSSGNCIIEIEDKTLIYGCNTSVIPNDGSVTLITQWAFYGCGIKSVVIPDKVTRIDGAVFTNCNSLTSVVFENTIGWETPNRERLIVTNPTLNADRMTERTPGYFTWWIRSVHITEE